ncbi:hypothetical protein U9M48_009354 [Paspalum notatum var. saurae]|uniref:Uncharacterized protein n=1 Tax=Paspalum notatum var. saurae TaxID=547442 RepID=A0AAQ3SSH8_PASNO
MRSYRGKPGGNDDAEYGINDDAGPGGTRDRGVKPDATNEKLHCTHSAAAVLHTKLLIEGSTSTNSGPQARGDTEQQQQRTTTTGRCRARRREPRARTATTSPTVGTATPTPSTLGTKDPKDPVHLLEATTKL